MGWLGSIAGVFYATGLYDHAERAERDGLSHEIYDALLEPAAQELSGKDELIVLPEGSLCAFPWRRC